MIHGIDRDDEQAQEDLEAIREGIADLEAGRFAPLEVVDAEIRERLHRLG